MAPLGGAAPSRMEQNPAAAEVPPSQKPPKPPDYGKPNKSNVSSADLKKRAGLQYSYNSDIFDAFEKILKLRESELGKTFVYKSDGELDYSTLGELGNRGRF